MRGFCSKIGAINAANRSSEPPTRRRPCLISSHSLTVVGNLTKSFTIEARARLSLGERLDWPLTYRTIKMTSRKLPEARNRDVTNTCSVATTSDFFWSREQIRLTQFNDKIFCPPSPNDTEISTLLHCNGLADLQVLCDNLWRSLCSRNSKWAEDDEWQCLFTSSRRHYFIHWMKSFTTFLDVDNFIRCLVAAG